MSVNKLPLYFQTLSALKGCTYLSALTLTLSVC